MMKKMSLLRLLLTVLLFCVLGFAASAKDVTIVDSGYCGDKGSNLSWVLDNEGTLTISGEGKMANSKYSSRMDLNYGWQKGTYYSQIKRVVFEEGVESIGESAFMRFSTIKSVSLSSSIKEIGKYAFASCTSLEKISFPEGLVSLGMFSFSSCDSLAEISLPKSLKQIPYCCFMSSKIETISFSEGLEEIGASAFARANFSVLLLPEGLKTIEKEAFSKAWKKNQKRFIYIPSSVDSIEQDAFYTSEYIEGSKEYYAGSKQQWEDLTKDISHMWMWDLHYNHKHQKLNQGTFYKNGSKNDYCIYCNAPKNTTLFAVENVSISSTSFNYTGQVITPVVTVKNSKGHSLKNGTDYKLSYSPGRIDGGTYQATLTLIGNYTGTKTWSFIVYSNTASLKLNKTKLSLGINQTYILTAKILPNTARQDVTFSSSNDAVATVSQTGLIKTIKRGSAVITATTDDGVSAKCTVTIFDARLNQTAVTLNIGQTYTLSAKGVDSAIKTWKSTDRNIVSVSKQGVLKGIGAGSATVYAKLKNGTNLTCVVTVKKAVLSKSKISLYQNYTKQLTLKNAAAAVNWSSSNTKVAKVNSKGVVTGISKGTATITATCAGIKYTCFVRVKYIDPISVVSVDWGDFYLLDISEIKHYSALERWQLDDTDNYYHCLKLRLKNNTNKFIKYIYANLEFRNQYGDLLRKNSTMRCYTESGLDAKQTESFDFNFDFSNNASVYSVKVKNIRVVYLNNTESTFNANFTSKNRHELGASQQKWAYQQLEWDY